MVKVLQCDGILLCTLVFIQTFISVMCVSLFCPCCCYCKCSSVFSQPSLAFMFQICGKSFSGKGKLDRHRRVHSGERPFVCLQCNKAFSDKHNLEAHVKTHSEDRPYTCTICARSFRSRSHLRAHRRVHTEVIIL